MDLELLRSEINDIDKSLLELFLKRMEVCSKVAEYKIEKNLPVFQSDRERQVIDKIRSMSNAELEDASELLFTSIMDISKCLQYRRFFAEGSEIESIQFSCKKEASVACPGTNGSYSEQAAKQIFKTGKINFFKTFDEVFNSVISGENDFGIVPIQNSSTGSVTQTYNLLKQYKLHIAASTTVKISHCLVCRNGTDPMDIHDVYSHEQAVSQCSDYLNSTGYNPIFYYNTALAAELVAQSDEPIAAICSEDCAKSLGLKIIDRKIANCTENYTRFILISKAVYSSENANIISCCLTLPHISSALYRLLTKFSVAGLNLSRIESRPIASKDFDVMFYLDFEGSIKSRQVQILLRELKDEMSSFWFLGNYSEIPFDNE